jgi:arylsulfatase A-like enzyme/Tfp pilus assembly protein PilF
VFVSVACRREERTAIRQLNLVLITIDTLRPDRLGSHGASNVETPNLDRLARSGVLFENAVAQAPLTAPSHASMFTGQNPTVHKVRDTGGFVLPESSPALAQILQNQGWDTAAFVGAAVLKKSFGFNRGFAVYDDQMQKPEAGGAASEFPERRAGEVVDRAIGWLNGQSGKPFFLWVHVFDPHSPYDPPPPFREKYSGRSYDGEIAYTDQQLGRLLEAVRRKSPPENTLIAVLSDHGESLSDHGEYTHGVFLYDSTLRIAFMIAGPGVPAGQRLKVQARSIDLLPTILDLMGSRAPEGVQGVSLAHALSGRQQPETYSYSETLFPKINMGWAELRGIRTSRWKYVQAPKPELYDLVQDPGETKNVIAAQPDVARELEAKLSEAAGSGSGQNPEKVTTAVVDQRTMQQLKSLGYSAGTADREYLLTGQGTDPKDRPEVIKLLHFAVSPDASTPAADRVGLLRQALAKDPGNPTVYLHLGDEYQRLQRRDEALKLYLAGINNGVRTAWIYSRLGHLHLQQGHPQEAIDAYERAAQLNPTDCESLSDLGLTYLEGGRIKDAERVFQWCLATGEAHALTYNGLGLAAVRKQDMAAARGHFEKAIQLDPNLLEAYLNLGRIYKMMGANTRARECFGTFLAKAPPAQYRDVIARVKAELETMRETK